MEKSDEFAPTAVFAFRRPGHLKYTLDALAANVGAELTRVTVFVDGPRNEEEQTDVNLVVTEAEIPRPFKHLEIVSQPSHLGLSASITSGISAILAEHESAVVVEDDIVTSRNFLQFMNIGLQRFRDDDRVISIHGYNYPVAIESPFFLRGADCWGWATWRRGWALYEPDGVELLNRLRAEGLTEQFDFNGAFPYTQMLEDQVVGKVDSWAIRWYASAFLANRLTLYPGRTLVRNIGHDGTGTHGGATDKYAGDLAYATPRLADIDVVESATARAALESFFRGEGSATRRDNLPALIRRRLGARAGRWFRNSAS